MGVLTAASLMMFEVSFSLFFSMCGLSQSVRNHVKLIHVVNSHRGFSKSTVLCGGVLGRSLGDCRPALLKG